MNQKLLTKILRSPRLPSLPVIALEVIELVQKKDVDIKQIAGTIQHDPALASKILKTVNSSFYGQAYSISTVSHALVVLGLNSVKTLALGFSLVTNLKDEGEGDEGFDHLTYWKRSIYTATAAKNLAQQMGVLQQEEAFLGGLLQDMGMIAMYQTLSDTYAMVLAAADGDHRQLRVLECDQLETDHAEIGAAIAESWNLPPLLRDTIRYHETPDDAPEEIQALIRCVAMGNVVADIFIHEDNGSAMERYHQYSKEWFQLDPEDAEPLLREIHKRTREMRRLFALPTGELGNPDEILASANEALEQITLNSQQHNHELEQANELLAKQAYTDSLTGIANRGRFNEFISEQFDATTRTGKPMALLFLDADHFKNFNDRYGHPTGDRVLIELAKQLESIAPEKSLVARYGGEEFAVIVTDTDRKTAAQLAEQVRHSIEQMAVESDEGKQLQVTASIGVASYDGSFFERVEQFIKAADQGIYAAKSAGRNCVRIFTPRTKRKETAA